MPMLWTSVCVSSSQSSMCDEATRISCGPFRVPGTYDVVRSSGTGRMTTRALSKSEVVGVGPPNSPRVPRSYSNGRFIHVLESPRHAQTLYSATGAAYVVHIDGRSMAPLRRNRGLLPLFAVATCRTSG